MAKNRKKTQDRRRIILHILRIQHLSPLNKEIICTIWQNQKMWFIDPQHHFLFSRFFMAERPDVITEQIINYANAWLLNLGPPKVPKHFWRVSWPLLKKKQPCARTARFCRKVSSACVCIGSGRYMTSGQNKKKLGLRWSTTFFSGDNCGLNAEAGITSELNLHFTGE